MAVASSIAAQFEPVYWLPIQRMVGEQPQPPGSSQQFWVQSKTSI